MDEIVNLVAQRAGISREQAAAAVQTGVDFVKQRLPAPLASQLDALLSTAPGQPNQQAQDMLGKLFGA